MLWVGSLLCVPFVFALGAIAWGAIGRRRALRKVEDETHARHAAEEEEARITASILLASPARALVAMLDVVGVEGVFLETESDLFYVLAGTDVTPKALAALRDTIRWSTPVGLRSRVVTSAEEIPEGCIPVRRGVAA